ncbi:hypothetical protein AV926_14750 [Myroides marinus]|uniref:Uncharacterized protein n=1 Tax=Myroides marinus TaxID=703342 RepID=A0A163X223_9FLAO|nr:hypothetical protein [Myroides marinus]KZE77186.1 hypothetical protein AV926_14750 [Myroides marinus]
MKIHFTYILFFILFSANTFAQKLELYTNDGKEEYLGCLNCDAKDVNSIWNSYGNYGNLYSQKSIWNKYGIFGDQTSSYSPWNIHADNPPIVKKDGVMYGYFTTNKHFVGKRVEVELTKMLFDYYLDIKEDPSKWNKNHDIAKSKEITKSKEAPKLKETVKK